MAIPDYQRIMLPLLQQLSDENEHILSDITHNLANIFELTQEERKQPMASR